jgi:predicted acyl esterase
MVSYDMDSEYSNHIRYTSEPLLADIECTGYPIANLWISAPDCSNIDVFVYLQMVSDSSATANTGEQRGTYVTEGCFRAEHRCDQLQLLTLSYIPHASTIAYSTLQQQSITACA